MRKISVKNEGKWLKSIDNFRFILFGNKVFGFNIIHPILIFQIFFDAKFFNNYFMLLYPIDN